MCEAADFERFSRHGTEKKGQHVRIGRLDGKPEAYPSIISVSRITAASSESRSPRRDRSLILALPMIANLSSTTQTFAWMYTCSVVKTFPRNFAQLRSEKTEM
jgi:hypothetical protein